MASRPRSATDRRDSKKYPKYDLDLNIPFHEDGVDGENEVGSDSEGTFPLDPSGSYYKDLKAMSKLFSTYHVVHEERFWTVMPEDIFDIILKRLPLAARCRFRCVSQKWKGILPLSQYRYPCTIMSRLGDGKARFFCHSEQKWFGLPCTNDSSSRGTWEVVDVDAGLVLYQRKVERNFRLCVCNPLTNSSRVISPDFPHPHGGFRSYPPRLKLVVDRENKTFKVMVVIDELYLTVLYNSTTRSWDIYRTNPRQYGDGFNEFFVWKNVIYIYKIKQSFENWPQSLVLAFSTTDGYWKKVKAEFPCETGLPVNHFIFSDRDQVMLVEFCSREPSHFSIWKLLDSGSSTSPELRRSEWEKVAIEPDRAIENVMSSYVLGRVCYGTEYICFMLSGDKTVARDGFKVNRFANRWNRCVKYSFTTKSWVVMPCLAGRRKFYKLYPWDPSLDDFKLELSPMGFHG